jgi:hypothetical protein
MGLPCRHTLFVHELNGTPLQLTQFDRHWWWTQPQAAAAAAAAASAGVEGPIEPPPPPLNPLIVQGKGRPRGALALSNPRAKRGQGPTSTKRLASAFEITRAEEQLEAVPASSAPPILQRQHQQHHDTYDPGTAHPRGSQRYYEALASTDEITTQFEGPLDEKLEQMAQQAIELIELEEEIA